MVHYMAGDADRAAVITELDYQIPTDQPSVDPLMVRRPVQALIVLPAMQQPYATYGIYDATRAPNTWHYQDDHLPPIVVEPPDYANIGPIVHVTISHAVHLAAITARRDADGSADLLVLDSVTPTPANTGRAYWLYGVAEEQAGDTPHTWHDSRGISPVDTLPEVEALPPTPTPYVGAVVHYIKAPPVHLAAIVCAIKQTRTLDLFVLDPAIALASFAYSVSEDTGATKANSWHWPE
jgi:hypothetical protein